MTYDDRKTVCQKGNFRLEEWEDVNYCEHCFYNDDEPLGDEDVVLLLAKVTEENEQLKRENKQLQKYVYHCPQICRRILAYLNKCGSENVKAVNNAMDMEEYFDEEIDTLRL